MLEELIKKHIEYTKFKKQEINSVDYEEKCEKYEDDRKAIKKQLRTQLSKENMNEVQRILNDCEKLVALELELENHEQVNIIFPPQLIKVRTIKIKGGLEKKKEIVKLFPKNQGSSFFNDFDQEVIEYFHEKGSKIEGTPSIILDQQEKNKNYILNNFDKYVLNFVGKLVCVDAKILNTNDASYFYIGSDDLTLKGYEVILEKFVEKMINEKDDWEINWTFDFPHKHGEYKHSSGRVIWVDVFTEKQNGKLMLELNNKEKNACFEQLERK